MDQLEYVGLRVRDCLEVSKRHVVKSLLDSSCVRMPLNLRHRLLLKVDYFCVRVWTQFSVQLDAVEAYNLLAALEHWKPRALFEHVELGALAEVIPLQFDVQLCRRRKRRYVDGEFYQVFEVVHHGLLRVRHLHLKL